MAPVYKVAVIQLYPKPMQAENNFAKAAAFIRAAAAQKADLAVLPEYHLTNWLPKDPKFAEICADWERYLTAYQDLAKECNICIVPGTIVQSRPSQRNGTAQKADGGDGHDGRYRKDDTGLDNVAYFISNKGEILGRYVKKNLWGAGERPYLTSSARQLHPVFDTPLGKVGLLICWDLAFPEAFRELIAQGAKIIIIPTFWTLNDCSPAGLKHNANAEAVFLDSTLTARTFENTCVHDLALIYEAVIFANAGGPPGRGYAGLSQVCVPFIGPITRLGSCAEGMSVVDLDLEILEQAEENYQVRTDMASEDWHYDYRHGTAVPGGSSGKGVHDGAHEREAGKL